MTIYNLYIFHENGTLLYYQEWNRKKQTGMQREEEGKLLYGMLFSLKSFISKLSPTDMKEGFYSYKTNQYRLNFYETASNVKFILNTDTSVPHSIVREFLKNVVHAQIFVEFAVKNPLYTPGEPIQSDLFKANMDNAIKAATFFNKN